jgi:hypothetical protein
MCPQGGESLGVLSWTTSDLLHEKFFLDRNVGMLVLLACYKDSDSKAWL